MSGKFSGDSDCVFTSGKRNNNNNNNDDNMVEKMYHAHNEKWKKTNNGRNKTAKSKKNQNAWRKGNLQVIGNIGSEQAEMKEKKKKECLRRTRKLLETKLASRNLIKGINTCAVLLVRYSGPFL